MIPINQNGSDLFSMHPYDQDYYLTYVPTKNAKTKEAIIVEEDDNDTPDFELELNA